MLLALFNLLVWHVEWGIDINEKDIIQFACLPTMPNIL